MTPSWPLRQETNGLTGDPRDDAEVAVVVQQRQAVQLRGRGDDKIHRPRAPVLAFTRQLALHVPGTGEGTVVHRHPAEQRPEVRDAPLPVGRGPRAVEELQLGDRAHRDQARRGGLVPAEGFGARPHEPGQRAGVDQELRRGHRR
jgi:hypothetical protein